MNNFNEKVILLTGASSGIGYELAKALDQKGAKLALVARRANLLNKLNNELSGKHLILSGDLSDNIFCKSIVTNTNKHYGRIDIIINNAAISMNASFADTKPEVFKKLMDVNYFAPLTISQNAYPFLKKTQGSLYFISSVVGKRGFPTRSGYSASKFAVQGLFESLRSEWQSDNIHVGIISPGFTDTNIQNKALDADGEQRQKRGKTTGRVMSPNKASQLIINAIQNKRREVILTAAGKLVVQFNKFFPKTTDKIVTRSIG